METEPQKAGAAGETAGLHGAGTGANAEVWATRERMAKEGGLGGRNGGLTSVGGSLALSTSLQALMRLRMTGESTSQVSSFPFRALSLSLSLSLFLKKLLHTHTDTMYN